MAVQLELYIFNVVCLDVWHVAIETITRARCKAVLYLHLPIIYNTYSTKYRNSTVRSIISTYKLQVADDIATETNFSPTEKKTSDGRYD